MRRQMRAGGVDVVHLIGQVPEVPPLAQAANLPGFDLSAWVGVLGPAGMPTDITARLSDQLQQVLAKKEEVLGVQAQMQTLERQRTALGRERARLSGDADWASPEARALVEQLLRES